MSQPRLLRPDETWRQLRWWTYGQALSERLAGHIHGVAFVTGQKVTNGEQAELEDLGGEIAVEVYH